MGNGNNPRVRPPGFEPWLSRGSGGLKANIWDSVCASVKSVNAKTPCLCQRNIGGL